MYFSIEPSEAPSQQEGICFLANWVFKVIVTLFKTREVLLKIGLLFLI